MSNAPLFTALATSTRQLHNLLRCIAFTPQAEVYITPEGLKFTTEEVHAVQASTLLDKSLFSTYILSDTEDVIPPFKVNIVALLETLQIFGMSDAASSNTHKNQGGGITSSYAAAFQTPALGLGGTCKITYAQAGAPLSIIIEENGVRTTCEMNTYSLPNMYDHDNEIPLDRNALVMKIIMSSLWLYDAVTELASTGSETVTVNASSLSAPFFVLEGQGGPFGDSSVVFDPDPSVAGSRRKQPAATETFTVAAPSGQRGRVMQKFPFDMIKKAGRAMQVASKVSVRMDRQGVLSLQFMIPSTDMSNSTSGALGTVTSAGSGAFSFVDYRFVPLADGEAADDEDGDYEEVNGQTQATDDTESAASQE